MRVQITSETTVDIMLEGRNREHYQWTGEEAREILAALLTVFPEALDCPECDECPDQRVVHHWNSPPYTPNHWTTGPFKPTNDNKVLPLRPSYEFRRSL